MLRYRILSGIPPDAADDASGESNSAQSHRTVRGSDCQVLATLGTTASKDGTAVLGGHAGTETVGASALDSAWLESAFHGALPGGRLRAGMAPV